MNCKGQQAKFQTLTMNQKDQRHLQRLSQSLADVQQPEEAEGLAEVPKRYQRDTKELSKSYQREQQSMTNDDWTRSSTDFFVPQDKPSSTGGPHCPPLRNTSTSSTSAAVSSSSSSSSSSSFLQHCQHQPPSNVC